MEGGWRVSPLLVTAVVAVAVAAGCGSGNDDPLPSVATADPAATFAPELGLHPREREFPMSADYFFDYSTLEWSGDACAGETDVAAGMVAQRVAAPDAPSLRPDRLGHPPAYRHAPMEDDCRTPEGETYSTAQHTRPFDEHRPAGIPKDAGFYLDLLSMARDGEHRDLRAGQVRAPAYYEREQVDLEGEPGLRVTYWLLWGGSVAYGRDREIASSREGSWQRVDVLLEHGDRPDEYELFGVRLYGDGGRGAGRDVEQDDLELVARRGDAATHPALYAALGSHALHPRPGRYERRVVSATLEPAVAVDVAAACADCARWATWRDLRPLKRESWYGYGGGWGARYANSALSGPLGPSPF